MPKGSGIQDDEFVRLFAEHGQLPETKARLFVDLFAGLVVAGCRCRGSVRVHGLGEFRSAWWFPHGKFAATRAPVQMLKFQTSNPIKRIMSQWSNGLKPGERAELYRYRKAQKAAALSAPQSPGADRDHAESPVESGE